VHRFRALLIDPGNTVQERPVQIFGNDRAVIDDWAKAVLPGAVSADAFGEGV
jgi:outer membrane lipoprotein SlyB